MSTLQKLVFTVKSRTLTPRSTQAWKLLLSTDQLSPQGLAQLRDRRSWETARFAYTNSPFYRSFYRDNGFSRADLEDPESFYSLPFLTKDLIRENFESIKTSEANSHTAVESMSSGSTGQPLSILSDRRAPVRAYEWRTMTWWGLDPWTNGATIDRLHRHGLRKVKHTLFWWPTKRMSFNTLDLSEATLTAFFSSWKKSKPQYVVGFIGGVGTVANVIAARGLSLEPPIAVAVTAGPLFEGHRQEMEKVFCSPVYNHYRSTESNWLAAECAEKNGLHSFDDIKNLEVIDEGGSPTTGSEKGETVFTDFENRVFPLVRYRIGDRTSRIEEPCRCGRPFRRVRAIEGRIVDSLTFASGRVLTGDIFDYFEGTAKYINQYQIYQGEDYAVTVTCRLTGHSDSKKVAESRVAQLRARIEGEAPVTLAIVDKIEAVRGKFRPIVSDAPRR